MPGLWAEPIVHVDLTVADSSRETDYLPDLEAAGFTLTVREPHGEEHRVLTWSEPRRRRPRLVSRRRGAATTRTRARPRDVGSREWRRAPSARRASVTAVTDTRTDPPLRADEATTLLTFLDYHRDTLRMKAAGLTADQLDATLPPSSITLGGCSSTSPWWRATG